MAPVLERHGDGHPAQQRWHARLRGRQLHEDRHEQHQRRRRFVRRRRRRARPLHRSARHELRVGPRFRVATRGSTPWPRRPRCSCMAASSGGSPATTSRICRSCAARSSSRTATSRCWCTPTASCSAVATAARRSRTRTIPTSTRAWIRSTGSGRGTRPRSNECRRSIRKSARLPRACGRSRWIPTSVSGRAATSTMVRPLAIGCRASRASARPTSPYRPHPVPKACTTACCGGTAPTTRAAARRATRSCATTRCRHHRVEPHRAAGARYLLGHAIDAAGNRSATTMGIWV